MLVGEGCSRVCHLYKGVLVGEGCSRVCTISVSGGRGVAEFVQLVLVGGGV